MTHEIHRNNLQSNESEPEVASADSSIEHEETHRERLRRIARYTESRIVAYVLIHGENGHLVRTRLSSFIREALHLSESQGDGAKLRLIDRGLLEIDYELIGSKRIINSYKVDPEAIAQAIERGDLVAIGDPLDVPDEYKLINRIDHVKPPASRLAPEVTINLEQQDRKTADQLSDEEAGELIDQLEDEEIRFALVLRKTRTFDTALEMRIWLGENTRLSQEIISNLVLSFYKKGLATFARLPGSTEKGFGVLTDKGLAFLEAALKLEASNVPDIEMVITSEPSPSDSATELHDGDEIILRSNQAAPELTPEQKRKKKIADLAAEAPVPGYRHEPENKTPKSHGRHTPKTKSGRRTGER